MTELRRSLLEILPTDRESAMRRDRLADLLNVSKYIIAAEIKAIRATWVPILWCSKWLYVDYNHWAINRQISMIENMKQWYVNWMSNIQDIYIWVMEWRYD